MQALHLSAAVEVARRAGVSEVEWMLAAREAERALGRMLIAGREAGDIRSQGQGNMDGLNLSDLGVEHNLAADAVVLARVPDEVWTSWMTTDDPRGPTIPQQNPNGLPPGRHQDATAFRPFQQPSDDVNGPHTGPG